MVRSAKEGQQLFAKLIKVTDRFLDVAIELVAVIPFDENMRKSVRKQKVIVEAYPQSPAAIAYVDLAKRLSSWPIPKQASGHLEFFIEQLLTN
jgi:flagellar biosynthesis protein FlhG